MDKKMSDQERIKSFYRAIGKAMRDHDIEALAGIWFGCDDLHGQLLFHNVADLKMEAVVKGISERWEAYLREEQIEQGKQMGFIRELDMDDSENN